MPFSGEPALAWHFGLAFGLCALGSASSFLLRQVVRGDPGPQEPQALPASWERTVLPTKCLFPSLQMCLSMFFLQMQAFIFAASQKFTDKCQPEMFHLLFNELSLNQKKKDLQGHAWAPSGSAQSQDLRSLPDSLMTFFQLRGNLASF